MEDKETFLKKHETQLKEWATRIGELVAKAERAGTDAKAEYERQLEVLQAKKSALEREITEVRRAAEDAWESLRSGVEGAATDLKASWDNAMNKLK